MGVGVIRPMDDMQRINELLRDPRIFPHISCDRCDIETFLAPENGLYLGAYDGDTNVGFFIIQQVNSVTVEIHTIIDPSYWGKSIIFAKEVLEWIFSETTMSKVITFVPEYNRKAASLAERAGMEIEGVIKRSFLKNGELHNQLIYGIGK
jgi:RimJ/RimL family protein N-acetyltransferase